MWILGTIASSQRRSNWCSFVFIYLYCFKLVSAASWAWKMACPRLAAICRRGISCTRAPLRLLTGCNTGQMAWSQPPDSKNQLCCRICLKSSFLNNVDHKAFAGPQKDRIPLWWIVPSSCNKSKFSRLVNSKLIPGSNVIRSIWTLAAFATASERVKESTSSLESVLSHPAVLALKTGSSLQKLGKIVNLDTVLPSLD